MNFIYTDSTCENYQRTISIDRIESKCPHCDTSVQFVSHYGYANSKGLFFFVECPECRKFSILFSNDSICLKNLIPNNCIDLRIPDNITELSPKFCETYKQTVLAYNFDLDNLVGIGLSKAIECLVYDYLIVVQKETPVTNFSQNIKKLKGFDDDIIQLQFAKFLRNDEVHPIKLTEYTSNDLKESIEYLITIFSAKYATYQLKQKSLDLK